ncbi:hypothetical protein JCM10212_000980 [Sporobolomyces blumeae]
MSNLVSIPYRTTRPLNDLATSLTDYVASTSDKTHPDLVKHDALDLECLRHKIYANEGVPTTLSSTVDLLIQYYVQLSCTLTRFPDSASPPITWYPLFTSPSSSTVPPGALPTSSSRSTLPCEPITLRSLTYDLASTVATVASLHTVLATSQARTTEQALRSCIHHFQTAAGAYDHLVHVVDRFEATLAREGNPGARVPPDLRRTAVESLREVCLAQAQEVAWQKAVMDRLKNGTISKLAQQASDLYALARSKAIEAAVPIEVSDLLSDIDSNRGEHGGAGKGVSVPWTFPDEWLKYLDLKRSHFAAVAQYRRSLDDLGANRYGDELGRLTLASTLLTQALASTGRSWTKGGVVDTVVKDLKGFKKTVDENLARATKDNDLIYLAHPTPPASLAAIVPFSLSKPTPPPAIVSPLSPETLSLYPPLFKDLERKEVGIVEGVWQDRKKAWCDEVETSGKELEREAREHLDTEQTTNEFFLSTHGSLRWTRPASTTLSEPLRARVQHLTELSNAAKGSDQLVRTKYAEWAESIQVLESGEERLRRAIPDGTETAARSDDDADDRDDADERGRDERRKRIEVEREIRARLDRLKDVEDERRELERRIGVAVRQRDIKRLIVDKADELARRTDPTRETRDGSEDLGNGVEEFEDVLSTQLDRLRREFDSDLSMNRKHHQDLVDQLKSLHSTHSALVRTTSSAASDARRHEVEKYEKAFAKFVEMVGNLDEGLKFYADLSRLGSELRDAAKQFAYSRNAEAQQLDQHLSNLATSSSNPTTTTEDDVATPLDEQRLSEPEPDSAREPASAVAASSHRRSERSNRSSMASASNNVDNLEQQPPTSARRKTKPSRRDAVNASDEVTQRASEEEEARREPVAAVGTGGWDPSMGIRFG